MQRGHRQVTFVALLALLGIVGSGCSAVVTLELPTLAGLEARTAGLRSTIVSPDGQTLAVLRREHREPVPLADVPRHLVNAVLTAEDRRFFEHGGVDARAIARAFLRNTASGEVQQGGSTITQQLVGLLYEPAAGRTYDAKLTEALLAREMEQTRTKASILGEYLNTLYLGEGAYGVQAAAETYFRKDVTEIDLAEAALLAAIIRAPSSIAPTENPEGARWRRDDVLRRMVEDGHITAAERDAAIATPIEVSARQPLPAAREPHLVDLVVRTLLADPRFGDSETERADRLYRGGLTIHTTVDLELQQVARDILAAHLPDADDPEAAVTLVDPATGHVLALTGNRSYDQLQYDLPTQGRRQPGSTYKTFVLAAAIAAGYHPDDRLDGTPGTIATDQGGWEVRNYERTDPGDVTLAGATRLSVNAAYARLGVDIGISRVAALSRAMGVSSPVPSDEPQITLGGGELGVTTWDMAAGYATLANGGRHLETTVIERVEDADGEVVWQPNTTGEQALPPDVAYVTTNVLEGVVEAGTGLAARVPGWQVAGKTGTTSDHADAWFAGTTPVLSAAVWVGHVEGRVPLEGVQGVSRVTGGSIPAEIFSDVMAAALADREPVPFELADEFWVHVEVDPRTGLRAAAWCPGERIRVPRILAPTVSCPEPERPPARPAPAPEPIESEPPGDDETDIDLEPAPTHDGTTDDPDVQPSPTPAPTTEPPPADEPSPDPTISPSPTPTPTEPAPDGAGDADG
ncbi:transglycosylase domain-containing protein [Nitriliruptor alkaliphilus]|uniref:transglycosylase domain-containing protein n=1 Tax=Nitriliruptor alkaliphilus TaxID=427918 RepID=UPI000697F8AA|nr:transglycosylase domain-containing protein [Nitriliruptor alkaliphilus]